MEESGSYLRVAPTEDIFDIIDNAHRVEGGHCGVRKTFCRVHVNCIFLYSAYIRTLVSSLIHRFRKYIKMCTFLHHILEAKKDTNKHNKNI